jgi:hypothetical protein
VIWKFFSKIVFFNTISKKTYSFLSLFSILKYLGDAKH